MQKRTVNLWTRIGQTTWGRSFFFFEENTNIYKYLRGWRPKFCNQFSAASCQDRWTDKGCEQRACSTCSATKPKLKSSQIYHPTHRFGNQHAEDDKGDDDPCSPASPLVPGHEASRESGGNSITLFPSLGCHSMSQAFGLNKRMN